MTKAHLEVVESVQEDAQQAVRGNNPLADLIVSLQARLEAVEAKLAAIEQHVVAHSHNIDAEVVQQITAVAARAAVLHINEHLNTLLAMGKTLLEK